MPLVTSTEMFKKAYEGGYAIGAFNVNNMEIIQGITEAAMEENAPRHPPGVLRRAQLCKARIPYEAYRSRHRGYGAAHLRCISTTATAFELCKSCIDGGFTSVMIDGSHHSFEDNIALTKQGRGVRARTEASWSRVSWAGLPASRTT